MDLEYCAAVLLYLHKKANPTQVRLELQSRDTAGGNLGSYVRAPTRCRLEPA